MYPSFTNNEDVAVYFGTAKLAKSISLIYSSKQYSSKQYSYSSLSLRFSLLLMKRL